MIPKPFSALNRQKQNYLRRRRLMNCTSFGENDKRTVTIEATSDTPRHYAVNAKAYPALIDLVTGICKQNGINKLM
jgi:hypothetical protein